MSLELEDYFLPCSTTVEIAAFMSGSYGLKWNWVLGDSSQFMDCSLDKNCKAYPTKFLKTNESIAETLVSALLSNPNFNWGIFDGLTYCSLERRP
ncbi:hypothetical protein V6N12_039271 [Hibiscus sabdariffa]|uniref:Uncharacterized protein n=1 Tax=Hibiscus sabdariffa TaxID=183260 RepID=A0ABR2E1G2_9ROSI